MIKCYEEVRKPIVGVNRLKALGKTEAQSYGSVILEKTPVEVTKSGPTFQRLRYVGKTRRKLPVRAGPLSRTIVGRYILTPAVFDVLQSTPKNNLTQKIEITDALAELRRRDHRICAYDFSQTRVDKEIMLPTASIRALMQKLFESISDEPERLQQRVITATREALAKLS